MRLFLYALLGIGLIGQAVAADPVPARIAVISTSDTADLAALVTAELSNSPDIVLVERDALSKIGDDAKIQTMAGNDATALGKLLNADGLLILDKQNDAIHARLTAVGLGYSVFDLQIAPGIDVTALAKSLGHRAEQFAPKLKLTSTQAVPISILNLRAEISGSTAVKTERDLTLLLESRLASIPEYVVLERRHAWDLGFEHSLISTSSPQLLKGAYVLDGTLKISPGNDDGITVQLRVRAPKSTQESPLEIRGRSGDLPGLVEALVTQISKTIGSPVSTTAWQPQTEAREYLTEGIWAWEHGQPQASIEALDSAELLGETAPDLYAARLQAICRLAVPTMNPFLVEFISRVDSLHVTHNAALSGRNYAPVLPLPDRVALVQRAFSDFPAYQTAVTRPGAHLQFLDPKWQHAVQLAVAQGYVNYAASRTLAELDAKADPETQAFRGQLRQFLRYDPLKGKIPWDRCTGAFFADEWSESQEEEIAYYRLVLSGTTNTELSEANALKIRFIWEKGAVFCPRFIKDPADQQRAYLQFAQTLAQAPETNLNGLLLLSAVSDASISEPAYSTFLDDLGVLAKDPARWEEFVLTCKAAVELPEDFRHKLAGHGVPALHSYLDQSSYYSQEIFRTLWFPMSFPPKDAPTIWKEFLDFKARVLASGTHSHPEVVFGPIESAFHQALPGLQQETPAPPTAPLAVTRFWQPGINEHTGKFFYSNAYVLSGDTVAVRGFNPGGYHNSKIYFLHLPDFKADWIDLPPDCTSYGYAFSPEALYMTGFTGNPADAKSQLYRYDRARQAWDAQDIPASYQNPFLIQDRLFVVFNTTDGQNPALAEYDWSSQKTTILASARRRPAENQFDDRRAYQIINMFASLGGTIGVQIDRLCFTLNDKPGNWPEIVPGYTQAAYPVGNKTILQDYDQHLALLIDPAKAQPENLFAEPGIPAPDALAAFGPPRWHLDKLTFQSVFAAQDNLGQHGDAFFVLKRHQDDPAYYELFWLDSAHGDTPVHIPFQLTLAPETTSALKALQGLPEKAGDPLNPAPTNNPLRLIASDTGICLYTDSGLWFIPYGDIDAYLKSVQK